MTSTNNRYTNIKSLNKCQRKVLNACYDGWWMSGVYTAQFANHRRTFEADSPTILFADVNRWFESHAKNHANDRVLVRCVRPM